MDLTPDIGLVIWTVATSVLLMALLARFALKPLRRALDEREATMQASLDRSREAREEAERILAENNKRLSEAREEARSIINEGHKIVTGMTREAEQAAKSEADLIIKQARVEIDQEVQRGMDELKETVANLSLRIARQVIHGEIDSGRQEKLVDNFIERMKKSYASQKPQS